MFLCMLSISTTYSLRQQSLFCAFLLYRYEMIFLFSFTERLIFAIFLLIYGI